MGTAIDALQHPRRWNIWLLTRSQNSLALPSPYLAAAREPTGDSVRINTQQHFPTLEEAWTGCALETSPWSLQEGGHGGGGGGGSGGGAGGRGDERTEPWRRTETVELRVTVLHLDGEDLTLNLF